MYVINSKRTLISLKEPCNISFFKFQLKLSILGDGRALCVFVYVRKLNCEYKEL